MNGRDHELAVVVGAPVACRFVSVATTRAIFEEEAMPPVTVFNLRRTDPLSDLERATRRALNSMPELAINDREVDFVPILSPDGFDDGVTRINVDVWEQPERTKEKLQELAMRIAQAFRATVGAERKVKVVIRPYDVDRSGWVSL
jgi:phenylpyruvate tautomerase PptA (4-oxalocrotonate tautomerase family)